MVDNEIVDIILLHKPDKTRVPRSGSSIYY
jgi:hypothetical protein